MKKILKSICIVFCFLTTILKAETLENKQLFTIHGFLGSDWNLYYIARPLEKEHMEITYWDYPSRDKTIKEHGADLAALLRKHVANHPGQPINFLTHSMGGLVLRAALNHPDCPAEALIGKAVLLAPPNQGSCWGRFLSQFAIANAISKDQAGKELMSELDFEYLGQFPETMEVFVIAGNFSANFFIEEENDGIVKVEETRLKTPHLHETIWVTHETILISRRVAKLVHDFLVGNLII